MSEDIERKVAEAMRAMLRELGALSEPSYLDISRTPERVARMYVRELLSSYSPDAYAKLLVDFTMFDAPNDEMVLEQGIPFTSLCAHHLLPFYGEVHVGYIPNKKVAGLSKIPRAVNFFSRKLQMQERLTGEVADFIHKTLRAEGTIVLMDARHLCMETRGIRVSGVKTKTSALRGVARKNRGVASEFYRLLSVK
jgi:GTP cyclohydrolase IA